MLVKLLKEKDEDVISLFPNFPFAKEDKIEFISVDNYSFRFTTFEELKKTKKYYKKLTKEQTPFYGYDFQQKVLGFRTPEDISVDSFVWKERFERMEMLKEN